MQQDHAPHGRSYLDTNAISDFSTIPVKTLELYRRTGNGPEYIRIGKRVVYELSVVIAWMDAHRRRSTSEKVEVER